MVKSVGLRDCKVKLVVCTPLADDGFPKYDYSKGQDRFYTSDFQARLSIRESLVLVSMLRTISVFDFGSLPSHLDNITITDRVLTQGRRKCHH